VRRQRRGPLLDLLEREVVGPREAHAPGGEGLERFFELELPVPLQRRRAEDHHHLVGLRVELKDVLYQPGQVELLADERRVVRERIGGERAPVHSRVDHRRGGEQAAPVLGDEPACRRADGHDQVRLPRRHPLGEELGEGLLHVGLRVARHVERDLVEIHRVPAHLALSAASNAVEWVVKGGALLAKECTINTRRGAGCAGDEGDAVVAGESGSAAAATPAVETVSAIPSRNVTSLT
jgi:hypothetical protein